MNIKDRFPRAPLIKFVWIDRLSVTAKNVKKPVYKRYANFGNLYIPFLCVNIQWRLSWLPEAAYEIGYDTCYRILNGLGDKK